jgi:hypothetical protein
VELKVRKTREERRVAPTEVLAAIESLRAGL